MSTDNRYAATTLIVKGKHQAKTLGPLLRKDPLKRNESCIRVAEASKEGKAQRREVREEEQR